MHTVMGPDIRPASSIQWVPQCGPTVVADVDVGCGVDGLDSKKFRRAIFCCRACSQAYSRCLGGGFFDWRTTGAPLSLAISGIAQVVEPSFVMLDRSASCHWLSWAPHGESARLPQLSRGLHLPAKTSAAAHTITQNGTTVPHTKSLPLPLQLLWNTLHLPNITGPFPSPLSFAQSPLCKPARHFYLRVPLSLSSGANKPGTSVALPWYLPNPFCGFVVAWSMIPFVHTTNLSIKNSPTMAAVDAF